MEKHIIVYSILLFLFRKLISFFLRSTQFCLLLTLSLVIEENPSKNLIDVFMDITSHKERTGRRGETKG